ncbi:hypothetical protein L2E82_01049 [Cichorium intybus]|uniref:Uncharacterized protein n=1 Tax=Cichorium intybus TaxID=13427 RepID=A0ACB9GXG6_CICIN|nr:hypothetical protein L2E82_01049 [Cichorium intybus]
MLLVFMRKQKELESKTKAMDTSSMEEWEGILNNQLAKAKRIVEHQTPEKEGTHDSEGEESVHDIRISLFPVELNPSSRRKKNDEVDHLIFEEEFSQVLTIL